MTKEYFLGLDMGTGSVGWAVTDEEYKICRAHGKALWGVRLFESAATAEERRGFRTARRRLERRNRRLELLQELFAEEIMKVDEGFYHRMKESRYLQEDKREQDGSTPALPYALFVEDGYTDKEYHRQFPTIYHLRKWLMNTEETPDIRLVYLALHHMMKHRGHFLFSGSLEAVKEFKGVFGQLVESIASEELDFHISDAENIGQIEGILRDTALTRSAKKACLVRMLGAKTTCEKGVLALITGNTVKLNDLFESSDLDDCERPKICFSDNQYEEYMPVIQAQLGEQYFLVEQAKAVYDWSVLADILGDYTSISEAKVAVYEKHKKDLAYLKRLVRQNLGREAYREIFVRTGEKLANYSAYIGMTKVNGRKVPVEGKQCSREDFYAYLKKKVLGPLAEEQTEYLRAEMEKGTFLPKQVTKENGVLPHQVHLYELDRIIENLQERVPVLKQSGEKIRKIFTFRIPYYVGPLNGIRRGEGRTNWVQRKSMEKIFPWNFEEVVDIEASAEQFIRRMTNKCTYLAHEDVLPQNSLLYAKFVVLNELNNLRLGGEPISVELKQRIYTDLFQRTRRVTQKKLRDYLKREGIVDEHVDITGIDGDFKGSLTAYHDFKEKLTGCELSQEDKENIILNITLFGDDKKLLGRRLAALYPGLTEKQRRSLCTFSYRGWGRLSHAFLDGITAPAPETGEAWSIIRCMWETNDNLMQVLSEKYGFVQAVEDENSGDEAGEITYRNIEELYVSPAVKRQVWQTLQIVRELCGVMHMPPKRVFVEMAREKTESRRTESRRKQLIDLYKSCKDEERDWIAELGATEEHILRSDKLYLYYTQKGHCMYTGDVITLEDLWDNTKYDIDHIYPQSKVMDDSLNNRVLVKKVSNAEKTDHYPISADIRKKMQPFWKSLLDGGFIQREKYDRLVRATGFEPSELAGFIERQLVETRQSTKAVASILKQLLPDTEIVYVKARTVSQFRQDFDLFKVREMNDLHHAKDAYLNIVVGNSYFVKFTKNAAWYIREYPDRSYNLKRMFTSGHDIERGGEIAWKAGEAGTIRTVKEMMNRNNILVTRRSYQAKGQLFDRQLMKKGKGQVPVKSSDTRLCDIGKYGGYNKASGTYFMLVESEDKKGKRIRTIEYVPLYLKAQIEQNGETAISYLEERGLKNPRILLAQIKIDTLFKVDGFYMWLSGRTGNRLLFKGANQLLLSNRDAMILKKVSKFRARLQENKNIKIVERDELPPEDLLRLYDVFLDKVQNTVYHVRLGAQEKTLAAKREQFMELCDEDKCIVLCEIVHMFQCQSTAANLSLIGGPAQAGIIVIGNNIEANSQISIIHQSPAGIYEQEIDLKKL